MRPLTDEEKKTCMRMFLQLARERGATPHDVSTMALGLVVHICRNYSFGRVREELRQCAENLRRYADDAEAPVVVLHEDEVELVKMFDFTPKG